MNEHIISLLSSTPNSSIFFVDSFVKMPEKMARHIVQFALCVVLLSVCLTGIRRCHGDLAAEKRC